MTAILSRTASVFRDTGQEWRTGPGAIAIAQPVPARVLSAYQRLVQAGFTSQLLPS